MLNEGRVQTTDLVVSDGVTIAQRLGKTGETFVADAHGKYYDAVRRGNCYIGASKSFTVTATTDISPIPATTGRSLLGVFNPTSSGKNLFILKIGVSSVSGTPGGPFYLDYIAPGNGILTSIGSTATNLLTWAADTTGVRTLNQVVPAQNAVGVLLRPLGGLAAIALGAGLANYDEDIAGAICVPPGAALVMTAHAVGTSHVGSAYMIWEAVPTP